jgi:ubiquinone/menaquinone biosynthesis C-methylase UbiE
MNVQIEIVEHFKGGYTAAKKIGSGNAGHALATDIALQMLSTAKQRARSLGL